MKPGDPFRTPDAPASEHGLSILPIFRNHDWTFASQVAERLGIHKSTASKDLAACHVEAEGVT